MWEDEKKIVIDLDSGLNIFFLVNGEEIDFRDYISRMIKEAIEKDRLTLFVEPGDWAITEEVRIDENNQARNNV